MYKSREHLDRGVTIDEIIQGRTPLAIVNLKANRRTDLRTGYQSDLGESCVEIPGVNDRDEPASLKIPTINISLNSCHIAGFREIEDVLSFIRERYSGLRLRSHKYY